MIVFCGVVAPKEGSISEIYNLFYKRFKRGTLTLVQKLQITLFIYYGSYLMYIPFVFSIFFPGQSIYLI